LVHQQWPIKQAKRLGSQIQVPEFATGIIMCDVRTDGFLGYNRGILGYEKTANEKI
jgi:hypothetical protein